jgi:hypothetical protein
VRVERLENTGSALASISGVSQPVTASSVRTLFFPSLHIHFNISQNGKLRVGYITGAARADYDDIRPNVVINDANQTISGGNPGGKAGTLVGPRRLSRMVHRAAGLPPYRCLLP